MDARHTEKEIAHLIEKCIDMGFEQRARLCDFLHSSALGQVQPPDQTEGQFDRLLTVSVSQLVATRLIKNDRSKPLLTTDDCEILLGMMMTSHGVTPRRVEIPIEARREFVELISKMGIIITSCDEVAPYERLWAWIGLATDLAQEWGMPIDEFMSRNDAYHLIMRRLYTSAQFEEKVVRSGSKEMIQFMGIDENFERAMSENIPAVTQDESLREPIRQMYRDVLTKCENALREFYANEIKRIYSEAN